MNLKRKGRFRQNGYTETILESAHGPLTRYVNLRVVHAPGMPGTFSPPPRVSDPDMDHDMCVTHVPWCMPGSLISGVLWSRWLRKRSRHSRRMRNPQFYVSGKRSILLTRLSRITGCHKVPSKKPNAVFMGAVVLPKSYIGICRRRSYSTLLRINR